MEVVEVDELFAKLQSPDGVAMAVERRGPQADAHHVRDHHHKRAAPTGLSRKTDLKEVTCHEFTRLGHTFSTGWSIGLYATFC